MAEAVFYDTLRQGLWISVMISVPILAMALVAGVGVGLFQALTSVQEMTLTFVPKLGAIAVVYWISMGWMAEVFVSFYQNRLIPLIAGQ